MRKAKVKKSKRPTLAKRLAAVEAKVAALNASKSGLPGIFAYPHPIADELRLTQEALALCLENGVQNELGWAVPSFITESWACGTRIFVPPAHLRDVMVRAQERTVSARAAPLGYDPSREMIEQFYHPLAHAN